MYVTIIWRATVYIDTHVKQSQIENQTEQTSDDDLNRALHTGSCSKKMWLPHLVSCSNGSGPGSNPRDS